MPFPIDLAIEHDAWTDDLRGADTIEALADRAVAAALAVVPAATAAGPHGTYLVTDGAELSIVLCDASFIRTLNAKWRGKDTATNVLSFPAPAPMRAMTLGDIVVAYETSAREAAERGMPLADYLAHLIVHGVLHLVGLDHDIDAAADRMEALESRALATLGIASPYDRDDAAPASGTAGHDRLEGAAGLRATT